MKIIPLSEGTFTIDATKHFVPFDEEEHLLHERPVGSLLVEIQPFVVVTSRDVLLLDTGLGFEKNGILQLHQHLVLLAQRACGHVHHGGQEDARPGSAILGIFNARHGVSSPYA